MNYTLLGSQIRGQEHRVISARRSLPFEYSTNIGLVSLNARPRFPPGYVPCVPVRLNVEYPFDRKPQYKTRKLRRSSRTIVLGVELSSEGQFEFFPDPPIFVHMIFGDTKYQ